MRAKETEHEGERKDMIVRERGHVGEGNRTGNESEEDGERLRRREGTRGKETGTESEGDRA